ncbi:MAG: F0F1 ATP synthase subunit A [Nitrospirota bacterium]|jgi:F-type H+-transporting ATPase subunit a
MKELKVFPQKVFEIGPVDITDTVLVTWLVMAVITVVCYAATRRLGLRPTRLQEILEALYEAVEGTIKDVVPVDPALVIPVLGTLWIFIGVSNLIGLLPGLPTPTADINATFAFAVVAYSMSHVFGIKTRGLRGYLAHYKEPMWILLPFHVMAEVTRTVALAVRLFGNMLSGEMIALILLGIAGLLVPVPFDLLHIIIGLIQAYIFGMLTLVFIAGGIGTKPQTGG